MNKTGSALIFVSLVMAFIGIIISLATRSTMLYYGFALERMQHIRTRYALDALGSYGIACVIAEKKEPIIFIDHWPPPDGPYNAQLQIQYDKKNVHISGMLLQDSKQCATISCQIDMPENRQKVVKNWTYSS